MYLVGDAEVLPLPDAPSTSHARSVLRAALQRASRARAVLIGGRSARADQPRRAYSRRPLDWPLVGALARGSRGAMRRREALELTPRGVLLATFGAPLAIASSRTTASRSLARRRRSAVLAVVTSILG